MITPAWPEQRELLVVGAGPAGLTAATLAAGFGIDTLLLDEQPMAGGQAWRGVDRSPARAAVLGEDFERGAARLNRLRASGAEYRPSCTVFDVDRPRRVRVADGAGGYWVEAQRLILATGSLERPFPIPGWTLPGVFMAGGVQGLLKTAGLVPASRTADSGEMATGDVVLAGTGPLLLLLAWQYLRAGVRPLALLDTTPAGNYRRAATLLPGALAAGGQIGKGLGWLRALRAAGVRHVTGVQSLRALGDERLEAVEFSRRKRCERIDTGMLLLHQGVVPETHLARVAGCRHYWDDRQLCFRPTLDEWGASDIEGTTFAGDGCGIGSTDMAVAQGALAALSAAHALGRLGDRERDRLARPHLRELERQRRLRAFLDVLYRPRDEHRVATEDEVPVCPCNGVNAGVVRSAAAAGTGDAAALAAATGCGNGRCQGRLCGLQLTEIAAGERACKPREVGYLDVRAPIKPLPAATLLAFERAMAAGEAEPEPGQAPSASGTTDPAPDTDDIGAQ